MADNHSRRDELVWADLLQAFDLDENGNFVVALPEVDDYLFRAEPFSELFWTISFEMVQLNDYCVLCLQQTGKQLDSMQSELRALKRGEKRADTPLGDMTFEAIMSIEEEIPRWEDTYQFLSRAMCLILLSAFTEKSLRTICDELASANAQKPKRGPSESKIDSYIRHLREAVGLSIAEPSETVDVRKKCQKIRNAFAHGEWSEVRKHSIELHLQDAFEAVSNLLYEIEEQAWLSEWGRTG
jgi:hypothetical protein